MSGKSEIFSNDPLQYLPLLLFYSSHIRSALNQWLRATGISFLSLMTADGSGLISFAEAWWFTIGREPRWPVRNVQIHWTKTLIRRLAVARNWIWIAAHASQAKNPLK